MKTPMKKARKYQSIRCQLKMVKKGAAPESSGSFPYPHHHRRNSQPVLMMWRGSCSPARLTSNLTVSCLIRHCLHEAKRKIRFVYISQPVLFFLLILNLFCGQKLLSNHKFLIQGCITFKNNHQKKKKKGSLPNYLPYFFVHHVNQSIFFILALGL